MFLRLFGETLPYPTNDQIQTNPKTKKDTAITAEIVSAAYEPRFKLYGLGSARGDFHFINENNNCFSYIVDEPKLPILKILPVTNSSSFLSVTSKHLFLNHSFRVPRCNRSDLTNKMFSQNMSILSENSQYIDKSYLIHWIIRENGDIYYRTLSIEYDIADIAISSAYPRYALLMTNTGSLRGFSIEHMEFTPLYIDYFENLNIHSIFCPNKLTYFICHDRIEIIDLKLLEISKGPSMSVLQIDMLHEKSKYIAGIDTFQKRPSLFERDNFIKSITADSQSSGKFAVIIKDKEWASIISSNNLYSIYHNDQLKIQFNKGEMLVPSIFVQYEKPLVRENPQSVTFITSHGQFFDLNGNSIDHFIMKTIKPKYSFVDKNDNIYVFNTEQSFSIFENYSYIGDFPYKWKKPLAVLNGYALCPDDENGLIIVNVKRNEKVNLNSPLIQSPVKSHLIYSNYIDILCENNDVIRFDLQKEIFQGQKLQGTAELLEVYMMSDQIDGFCQMWRPINDTIAIIQIIDSQGWFSSPYYGLTINSQTLKISSLNEDIIYFSVINELGQVTINGHYIIVVTTSKVSLFSFIGGTLRLARQLGSTGDAIIDSSIMSNGILIVHSQRHVKYVPLPDISFGPVFNHRNCNVTGEVSTAMVPGRGFIEFGKNEFSIHLNKFRPIKCFDERSLPQRLESKSRILGLIPFESEISDDDLDAIFRCSKKKGSFDNKNARIHELIQNIVTRSAGGKNCELKMSSEKGYNVYKIYLLKYRH